MFDRSADLYDAIYTRVKDYGNEARQVLELIRLHHPEARTALNVACGTGEHDRTWKEELQVDGLDLNAAFVEIARAKNPAGDYRVADMIDFDFGRKYDAVVCLFSSIGYVRTLENLRRSLAAFARHLNPGGVAIVEPWFTPESWDPGAPFLKTVDEDGFKLARMSQSETRDGLSRLTFHYLVGTGEGISHFTEEHVLGLFSVEETMDAFAEAGLDVTYDSAGLFGRGLYVGRLAR